MTEKREGQGGEKRNNARCEQLYATNACRCDIRTTIRRRRWRRDSDVDDRRRGRDRASSIRTREDCGCKRKKTSKGSDLAPAFFRSRQHSDAASKSNFHYSVDAIRHWSREKDVYLSLLHILSIRDRQLSFLLYGKCWIQSLIWQEDWRNGRSVTSSHSSKRNSCTIL